MNIRAFLGIFAALSLACACSADAAVQVSQSGWQWGNPTPQGNTIRAMDFVQGRGYAIGDDGTALRTDDGGATWTGLATGTSLDLTRIQAVTPDTVIVLGGGGCVVRRSDDGGRTFTKMYVLTEINCPEPVVASYFVDPDTGYLLPAQRQRPAHQRQGPDVQPRDRDPGHARRAPAAARRSPPTRSSPAPTPASSSSPAATSPSVPPTAARRGRPSPTSPPATSSA